MPSRPKQYRPPGRETVRPRDTRPSAHARGYDRRWQRLAASVLRECPVCEDCGREAATCVDHVIAREAGGADDRSNLRALCQSCHSRKTVVTDQMGVGGASRHRSK